jgi:hypothetical protein
MQRTNGLRAAGVVLHVNDQSFAQLQDLRPLVSPAGLLGPREHNRDAPVALLEAINPQVAIAVPVSPLDL